MANIESRKMSDNPRVTVADPNSLVYLSDLVAPETYQSATIKVKNLVPSGIEIENLGIVSDIITIGDRFDILAKVSTQSGAPTDTIKSISFTIPAPFYAQRVTLMNDISGETITVSQTPPGSNLHLSGGSNFVMNNIYSSITFITMSNGQLSELSRSSNV